MPLRCHHSIVCSQLAELDVLFDLRGGLGTSGGTQRLHFAGACVHRVATVAHARTVAAQPTRL